MTTIDDMVGKTMKSVVVDAGNDEMDFVTYEGEIFRFNHHGDCCESVQIEDICGDLDDLVGVPLLLAEEVSSEDRADPGPPDNFDSEGSYTWTFYKFATNKGSVTVRWLGESNGYYSEEVDLDHFPPTEKWDAVLCKNPSINLLPVRGLDGYKEETRGRVLELQTVPLSPSEAAVLIDVLLEAIPEKYFKKDTRYL